MKLSTNCCIRNLNPPSDEHGGGHEWVKDKVIAWSYNRSKVKAVGLFDKDKGAQKSQGLLNAKVKKAGKKHVAWITIIPGSELKECFKEKFLVPYAIEELLPKDVWHYAEDKGWLEYRRSPMTLYQFTATNVSFDDHIAQQLPDKHHQRLALRKVALQHKEALTKFVCKQPEGKRQRMLEGLRPTITESFKKLGLVDDDK